MKRYTKATLTTVQNMIKAGYKDTEISKKTKVKPFTVRYYRYTRPSKNLITKKSTINIADVNKTLKTIIKQLKTAQTQLSS